MLCSVVVFVQLEYVHRNIRVPRPRVRRRGFPEPFTGFVCALVIVLIPLERTRTVELELAFV